MKPSPELKRAAALDDTLEKWLEGQLLANRSWFAERPTLVDVGAYHGKFSTQFLNLTPAIFDQAILFEPNPENFDHLQRTLGAEARIRLERKGCDATGGKREFFCHGETFTGSLLPYADRAPADATASRPVELVTLDEYMMAAGKPQRLGLLKIDTQGNDLRVLRGAEQTLRKSRPWVISELIFAPLYVGQANPAAIAGWLSDLGYVCAGQFNEFYSRAGWLAWADGCFVPRECVQTGQAGYVKRPTAARAQKERSFWRQLRRRWRGR